MIHSYDPILVAASVLVAIVASYTALDLVNSVAVARGRARSAWVSAGALAMGVGIWSMHFVGMLAFSIPGTPIAYDIPRVALSVGVAVLASAMALLVVSRPAVTRRALILAALAMGGAIAGMHYIGMWSMRMPAAIVWRPLLVAGSILLAVGASFVALHLALRSRLDRSRGAWLGRAGGGLVMGLAIAGMHYTAMAAARFVPGAGRLTVRGDDLLATDGLAIAVALTTLLILAVAVGGSILGRELARRTEVAEETTALYRTAETARLAADRLAGALREQAVRLEQQTGQLEALNLELGAAEGRLRGIVDSALDAMITMDAESVIVEWNPHAESIFGWSAEEAIGRRLDDTIIPPRHRAAHREGLRRYHETGQGPILNRRIEIEALRRDGREFPVELAIAPIRAGGQTLFTAFLRDLTEQKRAAEQEREFVREHAARAEAEAAERRVAEILESITDAFVAFDRDGCITFVNSRGEDLLGRRREELIGTSIWEVHPEFRETELFAAFQRAMSQRVALDLDHPSPLRPGAWLHVHIAPTSDGVAAYIRDVTEGRKLASELASSQAELGAIVRGMRDVVLVMDAEGRYRGIAPTAAPLLYQPRSELLGSTLHEVFPEHLADVFLHAIQRVVATGEMEHLEYGLPIDGRTIWFDSVISPLLEDQVVWVARDVTERKNAEEALRAAKEEAEAANLAKSAFLSRMSHELRTPLNAILGFGQLLESEVERAENRESVEQILRAGQHLLALIDEVLDLARIEAGQISLSVEPVSILDVLRESVDLVRFSAARHEVTIQAADELASPRFVRADRQRLKQVLLNLLTNAIKYNRPGGRVTLSCEALGNDRLRIVVADSGRGIPAEKLVRLFTPFDRLDAEQTGVEGTGLGLALSRGLIEAMRGRLDVESAAGEGSRFWVELPLASGSPVTDLPRQAVRAAPAMAGRGEAERTVLVVEDNLANVRLMERIFRGRPHVRLLTAMQGSIGLQLARDHRPDLILLDLNLPDISGEGVLRQMRGDPELCEIPVFMISGDAIPSRIHRLLDLGAQRYVTKPFDVAELLRMVDDVLQQG